jgi:hypothetical protein
LYRGRSVFVSPQLPKLFAEVDKGRLVHRAKGSEKRISYVQIKIPLFHSLFFILQPKSKFAHPKSKRSEDPGWTLDAFIFSYDLYVSQFLHL